MTILQVASTVSFALLACGLVLAVVRLVLGPSTADRVIALDLLAALSIGFVGTASVFYRDSVFIDVGIILSLVVFLGTVAFARYLERRGME